MTKIYGFQDGALVGYQSPTQTLPLARFGFKLAKASGSLQSTSREVLSLYIFLVTRHIFLVCIMAREDVSYM